MAGSASLPIGVERAARKGACEMKRQLESEEIRRLSLKTLGQVFVARTREGLGCSLFESQVLTELVKDTHSPCLA